MFKKVVLDSISESSRDTNAKRQKFAAETKKAQKRLESLHDKYIDNEIGVEDYNRLKTKYKTEIDSLTKQKSEINIITNDISAQLEFLRK